ncbi:hypothetical protein Vadar_019648 [Vaccinium darrowii]|uniref:Uncharacterized protein n=1 Tax=Vaccinium darrowii TaxID=229202 RepID=A0ACB7XRY3_9ERIC|nr:hypothetical protein Vadar_019648 [Vaccinium darrowii]
MRLSNFVTLNTITKVMRRLVGAGEWEHAVKTFDELGNFGLVRNTKTMNLLLDTLCKENKVEQARIIFLELKSHIPPNAHTFNIFIHGKAIDVLKELENSPFCKPDAQSFCPLLKSCFKYGKTESWLCGLLDDMHKQHISLDLSSYTLLIHGICRANKCEWAYLLFEEMIGQDIAPRYHTCQLLLDEIKQKDIYDATERIEAFIKQMKFS